jgi:hypothetical protein
MNKNQKLFEKFSYLCKICKIAFQKFCKTNQSSVDRPNDVLVDSSHLEVTGESKLVVAGERPAGRPSSVVGDSRSPASSDAADPALASIRRASDALPEPGGVLSVSALGPDLKTLDSMIKNRVDVFVRGFREREKRKKNLVIFGLEEGKRNDKHKIEKIFFRIGVLSFNIERCFRIGKKLDGTKPRPLLVQMGNAVQKSMVLKRAPALSHTPGVQHLFVRADMDRESRERWRSVRSSNSPSAALGSVSSKSESVSVSSVVDPAKDSSRRK